MREPNEPNATCPLIDRAISDLTYDIKRNFEDLRDANRELREWGTYWKEMAQEIEEKKNKEIQELKEIIKELENNNN